MTNGVVENHPDRSTTKKLHFQYRHMYSTFIVWSKSNGSCPNFICWGIRVSVSHIVLYLNRSDHVKLKYSKSILFVLVGGILAYEYLVKQQQQQQDSGIESPSSLSSCQSLILASTPTSSSLIQGETKRLYREIAGICIGAEELEEEDPATRQENSEAFRQTHECRLVQTPLALMDSMAQAGPTSWRGIQAIADYEATQKISNIPSLVLVGEYDFCTEPCVQGWSDLITDPTPQQQTLANCSHYGMLEDERQYGKAISEFLHQQERK